MSEAPAPAAKEKLRKVKVTKDSGLFWKRPQVAKGEEIEVPESEALSLIAGKNAVAVGWKSPEE